MKTLFLSIFLRFFVSNLSTKFLSEKIIPDTLMFCISSQKNFQPFENLWKKSLNSNNNFKFSGKFKVKNKSNKFILMTEAEKEFNDK